MVDTVFDDVKGLPRALKGLQSSNMSRRNFFNFLAELDLPDISDTKVNTIQKPLEIKKPKPVETKPDIFDDILTLISKQYENKDTGKPKQNVDPECISNEISDEDQSKEDQSKEKIKCEACSKTFTAKTSLKRHFNRNKVCVDWIQNYKNVNTVQLTKGIHIIVEELVEKSFGNNDELECRYCQTKFTTKGNHHKHFNTATVCNQLAYQEFKKLFEAL